MPNVNLKINLIDKKKIFPLKAKYNPETRLAQVHRSLTQIFPTRFEVNPDHIMHEIKGRHMGFVVFVDNATRKSIDAKIPKIEAVATEDGKTKTEIVEVTEKVEVGVSHAPTVSEGEIDGKTKNTLDYLIEEKFWKSLIAKAKLPLSTILILLFAGGGLFYLIRDIILPLFGVHP